MKLPTCYVVLYIIWLLVIDFNVGKVTLENYMKKRNDLIQEEENIAFGRDVLLEENEEIVNGILMSTKFKEIEKGFMNQSEFPPAHSFLSMKEDIEKSEVFQIIKILPKGAVLHAHDFSTTSQEYILKNITYRPHLYLCEVNGSMKLKFFKIPDNRCDWKLLSELRKNASTANTVNAKIQQKITISKTHSNGDGIWREFLKIYDFIVPFLTFKSVYEDYFYQYLQELYDDKVIYLELRARLDNLYDLNGKEYGIMDTIRVLKNVADKFVTDHPDFIGVKIIFCVERNVDEAKMNEHLEIVKKLKEDYPSFIAGFDMAGGENNNKPLIDFAKELLVFGDDIKYFFHAGETNWNRLSIDINVLDAVLLNTTRIGHGFALIKHPKVLKLVKERNIAIEVNPISNQVLNFISDLRNHPATLFFAENYPVVVSCDNPSFWKATGLSYDFYEAFIGIMSSNSDLKALKKLSKNSLIHSAMSTEEKSKAFKIFERQWQTFLTEVIKMNKQEEIN